MSNAMLLKEVVLKAVKELKQQFNESEEVRMESDINEELECSLTEKFPEWELTEEQKSLFYKAIERKDYAAHHVLKDVNVETLFLIVNGQELVLIHSNLYEEDEFGNFYLAENFCFSIFDKEEFFTNIEKLMKFEQ